MISSRLEHYILTGVAEYKTFNLGGGAVTTIPVPEGGFIVLVNFKWYPFNDSISATLFDNTSTPLTIMNNARCVHQLQLRSGHQNVNYLIRDVLYQTLANASAPASTVGAPIDFNCYHKFTEDIQVDIIHVPDVSLWTTVYGLLPAQAGEPAQPNGYGVTLNTVKKIDFAAGLNSFYNPPGQSRSPITPFPPRGTNEFHVDYENGQELNDPMAPNITHPFGYPLITFGYVQFNRMPDIHT